MKKKEFNPYCKVCGGCGYIGCCGIKRFLEKHVKGKTNCKHEEMFIEEIIDYINKV
jgi:UDP-glucose 4-epimerase